MRPLLKVGDRVTVERVPDLAQLSRFDIVVFKYKSVFHCHFIWQVSQVGRCLPVLTRSLQEPYLNEIPIRFEDIIGRVSDHQVPFFTKAKVAFLNWLRKTA